MFAGLSDTSQKIGETREEQFILNLPKGTPALSDAASDGSPWQAGWGRTLVDERGFEPPASSLRTRRSPS